MTLSMFTASSRQPEALPATSTTRVDSVWLPSPVTFATTDAALTVVSAPLSIRYVTCLMPECASAPVTVTATGDVFCQPPAAAVSSDGMTVNRPPGGHGGPAVGRCA